MDLKIFKKKKKKSKEKPKEECKKKCVLTKLDEAQEFLEQIQEDAKSVFKPAKEEEQSVG